VERREVDRNIEPNPPTGATPDNYSVRAGSALNGVSCVTASSCTAVGFRTVAAVSTSLAVERYG
jgi:hypothetical protein